MNKTIPASFALSAYRTSGRFIAPLAGIFVRYRAGKGKEDMNRRHERFGFASKERPSGPIVWVHAASVGETLSVLPLIERIEAGGPTVLLTTGTVTSARLAAKKLNSKTLHHYMPLDMLPFVDRFLEHWKPDLALFVESELWPTFLYRLKEKKIPHVLINGRMSERSFKKWTKVQPIISKILEGFSVCLVQTSEDGERYSALGARRVEVTGNLKFDTPPPATSETAVLNLKRQIDGRPVWLAASTHEGEEILISKVHRALLKHMPNLVTIIAPRHPDRGESVVKAALSCGLVTTIRSRGETIKPTTQIYVADTIGEMGLFYRAVSVAFLGGSLVQHGGQNPIEPARLDTAIIHGPYIHNFTDIYHALDMAGGATKVETPEALARTVALSLLRPQIATDSARKGRKALKEFEGALDATLDALSPVLHSLAISAELEGVRR
jgi:3-deoxy-D-manno-octulosonic-acid transferase